MFAYVIVNLDTLASKQKMRHPKSPETIEKMRSAQQARRAKEKQS